mgnify:CR=1 FL=1
MLNKNQGINNLKIYDISDYNVELLKEKQFYLNKDKFNCNILSACGIGFSLSETTMEILFKVIYDSPFLGNFGIAAGLLSAMTGMYGLYASVKLSKECKTVDQKIKKLTNNRK